MSALSARDAYRQWAPDYETETAVSYLENQLVQGLAVATAGRTLLDVGCGTGRRLRDTDASFVVGVDLAPEMLGAARADRPCAVADMRALPLATGSFDVVWCRLAIGHVPDIDDAYAELGRVCGDAGAVIVTDLSATAYAAGHRRTFRDLAGATREVEHYVHPLDSHAEAARRAGMSIAVSIEGRVGEGIHRFYESAGRLAAYHEQQGLSLVLALLLRKTAG